MNNHTTTKGEIPWESEGSFEMVWEAHVFIWWWGGSYWGSRQGGAAMEGLDDTSSNILSLSMSYIRLEALGHLAGK